MSQTRTPSVPGRQADNAGWPARRAVIRFAWRLFRHEWRQQLLILALVIVAISATIVGSAVANYMATISGSALHPGAQIAYVEHLFGRIGVIESRGGRGRLVARRTGALRDGASADRVKRAPAFAPRRKLEWIPART